MGTPRKAKPKKRIKRAVKSAAGRITSKAAKAPRALTDSSHAGTYHPVSGPSRSRRFGLTLNINFGTPGHSCGWSCVYCPCRGNDEAKAVAKTSPSAEDIISALKKKLKAESDIETVILGGNTEPTLHPEFPRVTEKVLELRTKLKGNWAVICLSNGIGFDKAAVRDACNRLDQIWVKVDCADDVLFAKTNKPSSKTQKSMGPTLSHLNQLREIRVQTTLWRFPSKTGFQNWSADNLRGLLEIYRKLEPAAIHLLTVKRKKVFEGVQPVTYDEMEAFALRVAELGISVEVFA